MPVGLKRNRSVKKLMMILAMTGTIAATAADVSGQKKDAAHAEGQAAPAAVNRTTGVVQGLDARSGTVVISHEAVPALKWSAMTMPFKISPDLAQGLKAGQKIEFEFTAKDMNGTVTKVKVLP